MKRSINSEYSNKFCSSNQESKHPKLDKINSDTTVTTANDNTASERSRVELRSQTLCSGFDASEHNTKTNSSSFQKSKSSEKINNKEIMSCEAAVFADPEGSSHLGPYQPATKEQALNNSLNRPIRVYADGIYDLFHAGHARQLQQCKKLFPNVYLIVGCCSDKLTHDRKGKTVNNEWERYENLSHCRYVDEIVKDAPWELDEEFLAKHRVDFVAHDEAPYVIGSDAAAAVDIYKWLKDSGRFCATQRTEGVSTSDLITRIIKNYDVYIKRQLSRGIKPSELNVSKTKAISIKVDNKINSIKEKTQGVIQNWHDRADVWIARFIQFYQNRRMIEDGSGSRSSRRSRSNDRGQRADNEMREDESGSGSGPDSSGGERDGQAWSPLGFLRRSRATDSSDDEDQQERRDDDDREGGSGDR